jgi:ribonuclease HI
MMQASKSQNTLKKNENSVAIEKYLIIRKEVKRTRRIQSEDEEETTDSGPTDIIYDGIEKLEQTEAEVQEGYKTIKIWIDGACSNNGSPNAKAGYGVYFAGSESDERNVSERLLGEKQTNQRAELMASICAIEKVLSTENPSQNLAVKIFSDSKYVIDGITVWVHSWKQTSWINKMNLDLWKWLYRLVHGEKRENLMIDWIHVKGHQGIHGNEMADSLARAGACLPLPGERE